ncbi:hypothetical protein [Streptomyces sp. NPDC050504]|uniref:hypothetical protein n=1 Tax=Streptomyces sp. NPDC050504 TaxID=3365618 RepID=UPI00379D5894
MSTPETSRFVRLRVELVVEVEDSEALRAAALEEGLHAEEPDGEPAGDDAEALAHLLDPVDLVGQVPGVELVHASWSSEQVAYDPEADEYGGDDDWDEEDEGERYPVGVGARADDGAWDDEGVGRSA